MIVFILKRILYIIPVMLGVLVLVFMMQVVMPGDPVLELLPSTATQAEIDALRDRLGLNDPIFVQFGNYVWRLVTRGDLGISYRTGQPVMDELMLRFPITIFLGVISLLISQIIANPLGLLAAAKQYTWVDNAIILFTIVGASVPGFWLALMMIRQFSVELRWLPAFYNGTFASMIMPIIASSFTSISATARGVRTSMLEMIRQDYVRTARAKGQKEVIVIASHAFRNALIPVVTGIGGALGMLLGGTLIVESIFSIPGVGKYIADAVTQRNFPAVQGGIVVLSFAFIIINILVDITYTIVDPRMKTTFITQRKRKPVTTRKERA